MDDVPRVFSVEAPDDALAPRLRAGQLVSLDSTLTPASGDGVLIRDRIGGLHLRVYRQGVGRWEAVATNDAHPTLDSERDGLLVLAIVTAVNARWS